MNLEAVNQFLRGALALGSAVAGLFFLRYWKVSRDRLFLWLATAFWVLALNWIVLGLTVSGPETRHYVYLLRLAAFVLILVGVYDKNRRARR